MMRTVSRLKWGTIVALASSVLRVADLAIMI